MTFCENIKNTLINNKMIDDKKIYKINKNNRIYEINKNIKLGEGSYSTVYFGNMIELIVEEIVVKPIAIKKIIKSNLTQRGNSMLNSEIKIMKDMMIYCHCNIVKCYDIIDDIDVIYIIMEYCENGDLATLLSKGLLKYDYVKYYFGQIICAIKYLNENNIIHRDLKPKNMLISDNYKKIKICDFGFAKHFDGLKRVMTVCGSPLYMAPEIYQKIGYTSSVDVWALGLILYEMLFGDHPLIKYNDPLKIANQITNNDILIPIENEQIKIIEPECIDILKKMLKKDTDRMTITELLREKWIIECMSINLPHDNIELFKNNITEKSIISKFENQSLFDSDSYNSKDSNSDSEKELKLTFDMED